MEFQFDTMKIEQVVKGGVDTLSFKMTGSITSDTFRTKFSATKNFGGILSVSFTESAINSDIPPEFRIALRDSVVVKTKEMVIAYIDGIPSRLKGLG